MAVKRRYSLYQIRWLVGRMHVSRSDLSVSKDILRRVKAWPKGQRKMAVKDALKAHHENQNLYDFVMRGR